MKKMVPRVIRGVLYGVAIVIALAITTIIILNRPLPKGEPGLAAEALADSMLAAVNEPAWDQLRFIAWCYDGRREYVWDTWYHLVEIRDGSRRILLNTRALDGRVWEDGRQLQGDEKRTWIARAWKDWCNDSFWLNPVVKLRDEGTVRRLVPLKDGRNGLLVTYQSGGATPGDSYLWELDEEGLPVAWRMWAQMLPVKGLRATWENWINVGGARIATLHRIGPVRIEILDVRHGDHHSDLGLERDPFGDF
ncbi:MAG: hypothetical protein R3301_02990 [Saprospiraceae bacterium]|nr:hypothetical protein [Saprospiraceae bacterium]